MPVTPVVIHVLVPGERAEALLALAAEELGRPRLSVDPVSQVTRVRMELPAAEAFDVVRAALNVAGKRAGVDWSDLLLVKPPGG